MLEGYSFSIIFEYRNYLVKKLIIPLAILICYCSAIASSQTFNNQKQNSGNYLQKSSSENQNDSRIKKWLELAVKQNDALAQYHLGLSYEYGHGVKQNYTEAAKWYRLAAKQGNANAQYNLGVLYDNGHGVKQDYTKAAK